jgi:hypothetical protein
MQMNKFESLKQMALVLRDTILTKMMKRAA